MLEKTSSAALPMAMTLAVVHVSVTATTNNVKELRVLPEARSAGRIRSVLFQGTDLIALPDAIPEVSELESIFQRIFRNPGPIKDTPLSFDRVYARGGGDCPNTPALTQKPDDRPAMTHNHVNGTPIGI